MPEAFLRLSAAERMEILEGLALQMGRRATILEKDIWVCWTLARLFAMPDALSMAFKGGTSLSKAFGVIGRFSEDIDITIDHYGLDPAIDPFAPGLSRSKIRNLRRTFEELAITYVANRIVPYLRDSFGRQFATQTCEVKIGEGGERVWIYYPSAFALEGEYIKEGVQIDFGGHNSIQPRSTCDIATYAAEHVRDLVFPAARVEVLSAERTFWEKATLAHVACNRGVFGGNVDRQSRHWYDLAKLSEHEVGQKALANRALLADVVRYKSIFFYSPYANYDACLTQGFRILPSEEMCQQLSSDYNQMKDGGMFFEDPPPFQEIVERLRRIEKQLNE